MTGMNRVLGALARNGSEPWPLDLGGSTVTSIATDALERLLAARGLADVSTSFDTVQGISGPSPETLAALGSDTLRIGFDRIPSPPRRLADQAGGAADAWEARDGFGVLWRRAEGHLYFSQASWPLGDPGQPDENPVDASAANLADITLSEALSRWTPPEPDRARIANAVRTLKPEAEKLGLFPILDRDCAGLFEMSARLRGAERLYLDLYDDPDAAAELADRLFAYKAAYWDAALSAWGGGPVGIAEADDYGTEISLLAAPDTLRSLYIERYARLFSSIKAKNPEARIIFHSCGAVRPLIPDLIEAGIDALNPVHYKAAGMEPEGLKRDFGSRLSFWGGAVDTQEILPRGSPAEVRAEVLRMARILGAGGGMVIATVHNIQADVPTGNILAYLDAVAELRDRGGTA